MIFNVTPSGWQHFLGSRVPSFFADFTDSPTIPSSALPRIESNAVDEKQSKLTAIDLGMSLKLFPCFAWHPEKAVALFLGLTVLYSSTCQDLSADFIAPLPSASFPFFLASDRLVTKVVLCFPISSQFSVVNGWVKCSRSTRKNGAMIDARLPNF